ncbi:S1 family peptidase [Lysobacter sp. CA196]|uniref:S1 family peptidase n=1 Tax=Lysobacter sp. CA196 TaxID=3455606 RepID=UPI003F8D152D
MKTRMVINKAAMLAAIFSLTFSFVASAADHRPVRGPVDFTLEYAKYYKITPQEAKRRMAASEESRKVQSALREKFPDTFAGLHIEHRPTFRIVAKFTRDAEASLRQVSKSEVLVAEQAPYSLHALHAAKNVLDEDLRASGIEFISSTDIRSGKVLAYVRDVGQAQERTTSLKSAAPFIEFRETPDFVKPTAPYAARHGGYKVMAGNGQYCTTGFNAKTADGTPVVTTAGHCDDVQRAWNSAGTVLPMVNQANKGSLDIQWHRYPSSIYYLSSRVEAGTLLYDVRGLVTLANMQIGDHVCKYGHTTYMTCGDIVSLDFTAPHENELGHFVQVRNENGDTMNREGDSGGPVWGYAAGAGHTAWGTVHGRGADGTPFVKDLFFMPSDRFAQVGLTLLLTK